MRIARIQNPLLEGEIGSQAGATTIAYFIAVALKMFLIAASLFFLFIFIMSGFQYISSGGDKAGIETAKNRLMNAFIGLFIVVVALAVVQILGKILQLRGLEELIFTIPTPQP